MRFSEGERLDERVHFRCFYPPVCVSMGAQFLVRGVQSCGQETRVTRAAEVKTNRMTVIFRSSLNVKI